MCTYSACLTIPIPKLRNVSCHWLIYRLVNGIEKVTHKYLTGCCQYSNFMGDAWHFIDAHISNLEIVTNRILGARAKNCSTLFVAFDCLSIFLFDIICLTFLCVCVCVRVSIFRFVWIKRQMWRAQFERKWGEKHTHHQKQLNVINRWENIGNL